MPRWFNTADPCQEDIHYTLPPTVRLPSLEQLIAQRSYSSILRELAKDEFPPER